MDKSKIIEILDDWNFWAKKPPTGIKRKDYLKKIRKLSESGQIVSLIGIRRSGKSTLMLQFIEELVEKIKPQNTLYVNFEDPRFFGELSLKLLEEIYEAYLEYLKPNKKPYLFLDEIQQIKGWEKFVRSLHERKIAQIFVSGSTSKLLSIEFGTVLTGRHLPVIVYPLSFKEFLYFKGKEVKDHLELIRQKIEIKRLLKEYLEFGGFPQVVLSKEKKEILKGYFDDIIARDIVERHKVKKIEELKILAKYYLTNISSLISFRKIKKFLKIPLHTVERFSYYFSCPYLIFFIKKFSYSLKEQQVNPKKVFAIDSGLRNVISFKFSEDIGKIYENVVFLELLRKGKEIYYWKNKRECDFLIKEREKKKIIQVCFDFDLPEIKEREIEGLIEGMKKFRQREGMIITSEFEGEERIKGKKIKFIPLWKWLLKN